jgi:hypothetical protein
MFIHFLFIYVRVPPEGLGGERRRPAIRLAPLLNPAELLRVIPATAFHTVPSEISMKNPPDSPDLRHLPLVFSHNLAIQPAQIANPYIFDKESTDSISPSLQTSLIRRS